MADLNLPHIFVDKSPDEQLYTSPSSRGREPRIRPRNRQKHGAKLKSRFEKAWAQARKAKSDRTALSLPATNGVYLEFRGAADCDLTIKSLEAVKSGVRLLNVRTEMSDGDEEVIIATVFVPEGKKGIFLNKLTQYISENTSADEPRHKKLIESIEDIKLAVLESFWQDSLPIPSDESADWCEVWLRSDQKAADVVSAFYETCDALEIKYRTQVLDFPERAVVIIRAGQTKLKELIQSSDYIAEFRVAKETARYFIELENKDQTEWVKDLLERLSVNEDSSVAVCVLDTGANNGHPLIEPLLSDQDLHTVEPDWGNADNHGHGTLMCGIAAYGGVLHEQLQSTAPLRIEHKLESVKILPQPGDHNDKQLYGYQTAQGVSRAEIQAPDRSRVVCMAVTSTDDRDRGQPSSWSAELDALAAGVGNGRKRLFVVSAGNVDDPDEWRNYPESNMTNAVHDPAQSWNALTVGAFTNKSLITEKGCENFEPLAQTRQLSPFSTTSMTWETGKWPNKPDIVLEGGNLAIDGDEFVTELDDLSLLSLHYKTQERQFYPIYATSAAAGEGAWIAAQIQAQYPEAWPETIRALMVHSAEWPDALEQQFYQRRLSKKQNIGNLLRVCGYGVPSLPKALRSAQNSLTLIAEAELQPFDKRESGSGYRTRDMHLHELPWPISALEELPGNTPVIIRVTLSYFIEPGPGRIGWKDKYRYSSHGLDFEINAPTEDEEEFVRRLNKAARAEEANEDIGSPVAWTIGRKSGRSQGSVHSDIWATNAAEAAKCNLIGVFPRIGWWRERSHLGRWNSKTRYSLIVSVSTPVEDVDIYSPVAVQLEIPVPV